MLPITVLQALLTVRDEFFTTEWQDRLQLLDFLSELDWTVWVILYLTVIFLVFLENAYRYSIPVQQYINSESDAAPIVDTASLHIDNPHMIGNRVSDEAEYNRRRIPIGIRIAIIEGSFSTDGVTTVERIALKVAGKQIEASGWRPDEIFGGVLQGFNFTIELPKWMHRGEFQAEIIALADGRWRKSKPFTIEL